MRIYDPASAPRRRESGFKGDGWIVSLPVGGADLVLGLDTGFDSVAILRVPNGRWDRGERPLSVHAHADHDETIVIPTGAGTLYHGPDVEHLTATRFNGPVTLVAAAGVFHHLVMDPDTTATGTCFFTVPGTALVPFADRTPLNAFGKVTFADLAVVSPPPVAAAPWVDDGAPSSTVRGRLEDRPEDDDRPSVRIIGQIGRAHV